MIIYMENHKELINYTLPWLSCTDFSDSLDKYINDSNTRLYKKGEILALQGEYSKEIFFITKGMVKVVTLNSDGEEKVIWYSVAPSLQGIAPFFNNTVTNGSIIAYTDCRCAVFNKEEFENILEQEKDMYPRLINSLAGKIQKLFNQIEGLSFHSSQLSVCKFLYYLAIEYQQSNELEINKTLQMKIPFNQTEIAAITSVNRVSVTKVFSELKKEGVIDFDSKGNISIFDMDSLRKKCI